MSNTGVGDYTAFYVYDIHVRFSVQHISIELWFGNISTREMV